MSTIKIFNEATGQWEIIAASEASNISTSNPSYVNENNTPVSLDEALTKISNKVNRLTQDIAYVYQNGGVGGGGGGGTGPSDQYKLECLSGENIYTTKNSVDLEILITSGGAKKQFTIIATDTSTNKQLGIWKKYSMSKTTITINDLKGNTPIELSAYDAQDNYTNPVYIKVITGAIKLELQSVPNKTIYIGALNDNNASYYLTNNTDTPATFVLEVNGKIIDRKENITSPISSLVYSTRQIIFGGSFVDVQVGQRFNFNAYAFTTLNGEQVLSNYIKYDITVADSERLIIVTDNITEFKPSNNPGETWDDLTGVMQGQQLTFKYYLSCGKPEYSTFNMDYKIYSFKSAETLIDSGTISNIKKGESFQFLKNTLDMDVSIAGEYYRIELSGYAVNDPSDVNAQYTKNVYFKVVESQYKELKANNDFQTLLAYYSRFYFPNDRVGNWLYKHPTVGEFVYNGAFKEPFKNGVNLVLKDVNGNTSGFLPDTDQINKIPGIVLRGEAYGYVEVAKYMFPNKEINDGFSFFQASGFNISITYKAEESTNDSDTILSIGSYRENFLWSGFEITQKQALVKIGSSDALVAKLPHNKVITIDLDVSFEGKDVWFFKLYVDGTLSQMTRILTSSIDWKFEQDLYLGCRNDNKTLSNFSNVTIYDLKIYTSSQNEYAITQNKMSAIESANLINGQVDPQLDAELREKEFFLPDGSCLIWDKKAGDGKGAYREGGDLYDKMVTAAKTGKSYAVVLIEETSLVPTLYEAYNTATFPASDKDKIMNEQFPCKVVYIDSLGELIISTPPGIPANQGVRVSIQGTSSLSYNSKNQELYLGYANTDGTPQLVQFKDDWLPENRYTLKADVMDSAHVNNTVIGELINGKGGYTPFSPTPPMNLPNNIFPSQEKATEIMSKIKHTSEGFPCLLFIKYAPDKDGNIKPPKFGGIYNFNLGRHAHYNLGMKIITDYEREKPIGPSIIKTFSELPNYWDKPTGEGMYSLEIQQNDSAQGAFQQDDPSIMRFMADVVYSSKDREAAYAKCQEFYTQMANMALTEIPKFTMTDDGQSPTKPKEGFYRYDANAYYNFSQCSKYLNWNNACAYYMMALVFGMVDSMCKNLTLRNWGTTVWYPSFYDMDTANELNNSGQSIVSYYAHLHRWYNVTNTSGNTTFAVQKNYPSAQAGDDYDEKQDFASYWNRIWEVLENLIEKNPPTEEEMKSLVTIDKIYTNLRTNLFPDPEEFIDKFYRTYTGKTGSIIFNYDYKIKYFSPKKTYNPVDQTFVDTTDFSQLRFLHGNRTIHIKDWFLKRVYFFDSLYGKDLPPKIKSPVVQSWNQNKAGKYLGGANFTTKIAGSSRMLFKYTYDQGNGSFWIDQEEKNASLVSTTGQTIVYLYANKFITSFDKFKSIPWTNLANIDLPLLETLDLSNIINIEKNSFFTQGKVYDKANDIGLKNIRHLNLSGVKLIGDNSQVYRLDISDCDKLQSLDLSGSSITEVNYSSTATLKYLNLSSTDITILDLRDQAFLQTVLINDCKKLTEVRITNCNKLKNLSIPQGVQRVIISNCNELSDLNIVYSGSGGLVSNLIEVSVDNCPGLLRVNLSGQNHPGLQVRLLGAWNLEDLILRGIKTNDIILPTLEKFSSLKSLDISYTDIVSFKYGTSLNQVDYLNLLNFPNLDNLQAFSCTKLIKIVCPNNKLNPIDLNNSSFFGCTSLATLYGHFRVTGPAIFKGCNSLKFNLDSTYNSQGFVETVDTVIIPKFLIGEDVCNLSISPEIVDVSSLFESCSAMSYNDFKYFMFRLPEMVTNIDRVFKGCNGITGSIWNDMLSSCSKLISAKEAFANTGLSGTLNSRSANFDPLLKSTYGFLDFIPKVRNIEGMFAGSKIQWIDNNFFRKGTTKLVLNNIDNLFAGCTELKAATSASVDLLTTPIEGELNSLDFFIDLEDLTEIYPKNVFLGSNIKMRVFSSANNTFLFHTKKLVSTSVVLDSSLYSGVNLVGEIKENVFGGISSTIQDDLGNTYNIPKFVSILSPFSGSGDLVELNLSQMSNIFKGLNSTIRQITGFLTGIKLIGSRKLPNDIFKGCTNLNSISGFCKNKDFDNDGQIYDFPNSTLFNDCISLKDISDLFNGNIKLKLRLMSEGFKNCQLNNVSRAFSNTSLFGIIPYRLFYMEYLDNGVKKLRKTINNMTGFVNGCWCLGYDSNRSIDTDTVLNQELGTLVNWSDGIAKNPGTPVYYKLNKTGLVKSYNFDRDDTLTIPNPNYISDPSHRPPDYDINTPETIPNPEYFPGELAYDPWYLDGFDYNGATFIDGNSSSFLSFIEKYTLYDRKQAEVITTQNQLGLYVSTLQNYMFPTDLFRYCSNEVSFAGVLQDFNWYKRVLVQDEVTGIYKIQTTKDREGLKGRIPCRLLKEFTNIPQITNLFSELSFEAFLGFNSSTKVRGVVYPFDLFKYNVNLKDVTDIFKGTSIPVGVDINSDLFANNTILSNISGCWQNVKFDWREFNLPDLGNNPVKYPQINFSKIFENNSRIINASNLFAVTKTSDEYIGLHVVDKLLLQNCYGINNIASMFYNNGQMKGSVPEFNDAVYPNIRSFSGYLEGCQEANIINAANLQPRLRPQNWSQQK